MFLDRITIHVRGGDGGDGCVAFRREFKTPKGGPSGGDGGDGGSVILRAERNTDSLFGLTGNKQFIAESGKPGQGSNWQGKRGNDIVLLVPPGTIVRDAATGELVKDLAAVGDELVVAKGGHGGRGNSAFATSVNRAPREVELGVPGEVRVVALELKVIADVGLIGKPNAGKSTLLSRMSRAHPEIADYPFTTKYPNLGKVHVGADDGFVLADIPGLIEGAHAGHGLGHEFLRHVERTRVLVHLIEPDPADQSDPVDNYTSIREELRLYDPALAERPEILVVSKSEIAISGDVAEMLEQRCGVKPLLLSAVTGKGLPDLIGRVMAELRKLRGEA
jgi:GTP-binding protein